MTDRSVLVSLANVVFFVRAAFGLESTNRGLDGGYVGGRIASDRYHAWYHWPTFA